MQEVSYEEVFGNMFGSMFQTLAIFLIVFLVIVIAVYIVVGIFLNKFNKLVYGKGTPMAFIPFANVYLLGKLTVNKVVGLLLVFVPILTGTFTTNINGIENTYTLLPVDISSKVSIITNIVTFGLFIYAIFLYFKLKKDKEKGIYVCHKENRPLERNKESAVIENLINNKDNATSSLNSESYKNNVNNNINNARNESVVINSTNAQNVSNTSDLNVSNSKEFDDFMNLYNNKDN